MRDCLTCNKSFKPRTNKHRYCSHWCAAQRLKKPDRKCNQCGEYFDVSHNSNKGTNAKFCSQQCYWNSLKGTKSLNEQDRKKITTICTNCHKEFRVWNYRKNVKFCSKICYDNYRRDVITCKGCGDVFTAPQYEKRKYCSSECNSLFNPQSISKGEIYLRELIKLKIPGIEHNKTFVFPDCTFNVDILHEDKIIEFQGDYFHCNPSIYKSSFYNITLKMTAEEKWNRDFIKKQRLEASGYLLLYVWEKDFNENENKEIERCINFLNQK